MIHQLFDFIQCSPTASHTVATVRAMLLQEGFTQLLETDPWQLEPGGKYFTIRGMSSLMAFQVPKRDFRAFSVVAPHGDSPCFKVKESPEMRVDGKYTKLNTEVYGGMQLALWTDRPLSVAGRLFLRTEGGVRSCLVDAGRDLVLIPSLAIHMNRRANAGQEYQVQRDLLPLYGGAEAEGLTALLARESGLDPADVLGQDLFVYNRQAPSIWGAGREFLSSPHLDDVQCAFASLTGFLESGGGAGLPIHVVFDNEEVGSSTRQGAASTLLEDTLRRIAAGLGLSEPSYLAKLARSFLLSADNAHAMHPNYPDKCDPVNRPRLGGGVVLKHSGSQKYTTDGASSAIVHLLAERAGIRLQTFTNHADIPGGTTLGNLSVQHVPVRSADVGIAQLAMHSPYETCGCGDTADLAALARALFSSSLMETGEEAYQLQ